jgi:hypothetical protein
MWATQSNRQLPFGYGWNPTQENGDFGEGLRFMAHPIIHNGDANKNTLYIYTYLNDK